MKTGLCRRIIVLFLSCAYYSVLSLYLSACCSNARADPSYRIEASTQIPASESMHSPFHTSPTAPSEAMTGSSHPQNTVGSSDAPFTHDEPSVAPSEVESSYAVWNESVYQSGSPISPQPGDTQATWQPSAAASFPADESCDAMELLEKWMAVEGISSEALGSRLCEQLVLVVAQEPDGIQTKTVCYQRNADGAWQAVSGLTGMSGWVGGNGIMHGRKRGSNTSPAGLWSLGLTFGNSSKPEGLKMPWRDVTPSSDWVCDEESIYFNSWQERDDPSLLEAWSDDVEHLEDYKDAYAYACVIRYNTAPYTIPERGCAIFFHCSKGATGGCIGLPESDMIHTLLWLDPQKNPYILITGYQCNAEN